jgi:hypothetical protein
MATWITHLRIAENLLERIPALHPSAFAVGNIAPDSGVPDEKWETFTPPPEVSHFATRPFRQEESFEPGPLPWRLADLDFYRLYLDGPIEGKRFSFLLGYFCHLVADNLWEAEIGRPTIRRFSAEFAADSKFIWEIKRDWYGLDFQYVRTHPDALFWRVFLHCAYDEAYALGFMPAEAVQQRIAYIQELYQRDDGKVRAHYIDRPDRYLGQEEMDRFVDETSEKLLRIHDRLLGAKADLAGYVSALEMA